MNLAMRWYICQAVFCEWSLVMVWFWRWWICQAVFCDWSLEIGQVGISHWQSADSGVLGPLLSPGVASSLETNLFSSRCWSCCLPSDADFVRLTATFSIFLTCCVRLLFWWCVVWWVYLCRFVVFYIDYVVLSFNHVSYAVCMIVFCLMFCCFCCRLTLFFYRVFILWPFFM